MTGIESFAVKQTEGSILSDMGKELPEAKELSKNVEDINKQVEPLDILYIERTPRAALMEQCSLEEIKKTNLENVKASEATETKLEDLTEVEKNRIKEETGWSDEIIDNIKNMKQYEILKKADLVETEINGRKCLIKENIDLNYTDEDGISNRDRIARGLAPLDKKTGKPLELHHLGQKVNSPLVELTEEEHRTGEYEKGKKNQSLWHDNTIETEVHGEANNWLQERRAYWKARSEVIEG